MGAIAVACGRLTDEQLSELLELELGLVRGILSRLQLLQWHGGAVILVLHASFTDPEWRHDAQWQIDPLYHRSRLASSCLRLLQQNLKFNICGVETSYYRHKEIEDIQDRKVDPPLMYVGRYWVDHFAVGFALTPCGHGTRFNPTPWL
jgi:hypothetical protein